jgi:hypothetical protein
MKNEDWYELVPADHRLTQGDLIFDCPLLAWNKPVDPAAADGDSVRSAVRAFRADVVVMTQACDLEHDKVENVVLCPHDPLSVFKQSWEKSMQATGQSPSVKAWRRTCDDLANGYVWNQSFLNSFLGLNPPLELRVVDFLELYTLPRAFLESLLKGRGVPRVRLLPPYREHLSQAFARFFMRVGLPQPINKTW